MNKKNYWRMAVGVLALQLLIYLSIYDYDFYHIDVVREPMIEFLFFQSMLLGLHFRYKCENEGVTNVLGVWKIVECIMLAVIYFATKMLFTNITSAAPFQILNQIILWALLYVLFDIFMNIEGRLNKIEERGRVWKCITFISDRTLEIYLVQYVIISHCNIGHFPINWIILTATILVAAVVLRWCSQQVIQRIKV